jgi:hypothetical protein
MFHVVKDRIKLSDVKHINMFCMFYGSIYQRLATHIYDYVDGMGCRKAF